MTHNALDIANAFLFLYQDDEEGLTNLKINKLLYFSQGCAYQRFNQPLFTDDMEAWPFGPVVPIVYDKFKKYGRERIPIEPIFDASDYTEDERALLIDIARRYGRYSASTLTTMTHRPGTPWSQTPQRDVITKNDIKSYFQSLRAIPRFQMTYTDDDFIGYEDENGFLVLPGDYDDES